MVRSCKDRVEELTGNPPGMDHALQTPAPQCPDISLRTCPGRAVSHSAPGAWYQDCGSVQHLWVCPASGDVSCESSDEQMKPSSSLRRHPWEVDAPGDGMQ